MSSVFHQLRKGRAPSYQTDLLGESAWVDQALCWQIDQLEQTPSERVEIFKKVENYVESMVTPETPKIEINQEHQVKTKYDAFSELKSPVPSDFQDIVLGETPQECSWAFLGEGSTENEVMVSKMIKALELNSDQVLRLPLNEITPENWQKCCHLLFQLRPREVIIFGAKVVNKIFLSPQRLSTLHGKRFEWKFQMGKEVASLYATAVFHPDFIKINPKMKQTVWQDLKSVRACESSSLK